MMLRQNMKIGIYTSGAGKIKLKIFYREQLSNTKYKKPNNYTTNYIGNERK